MDIIKVCVNITMMLYNIHTTLTLLWVESLLWMHSLLLQGQYECCVKSLLYYHELELYPSLGWLRLQSGDHNLSHRQPCEWCLILFDVVWKFKHNISTWNLKSSPHRHTSPTCLATGKQRVRRVISISNNGGSFNSGKYCDIVICPPTLAIIGARTAQFIIVTLATGQ